MSRELIIDTETNLVGDGRLFSLQMNLADLLGGTQNGYQYQQRPGNPSRMLVTFFVILEEPKKASEILDTLWSERQMLMRTGVSWFEIRGCAKGFRDFSGRCRNLKQYRKWRQKVYKEALKHDAVSNG